MSLESWEANGWLRKHQTSRQEVDDLLRIVERDLRDAAVTELSADWKFGILYNAALKLCTLLLYAEGYRAERNLQHYRTIQALPLILGQQRQDDADYLDACRVKRNVVEYDRSGVVSAGEVAELEDFAAELRAEVSGWLRNTHPELLE